jgi:hypothetical protein
MGYLWFVVDLWFVGCLADLWFPQSWDFAAKRIWAELYSHMNLLGWIGFWV